MPLLRRVFDLVASGLSDREVAERTDLKKKHVAELLTNRICGMLFDILYERDYFGGSHPSVGRG